MTVNVQGSCNNLCDTNPDSTEFTARKDADIAWLQQSFALAKANGNAAMMIVSQADPGWDDSDATRAPTRDPKTLGEDDQLPSSDPAFDPTKAPTGNPAPDGFHDILVAVRTLTVDFNKPVVYVNGDSHYFRVDKPLVDATGKRLENFTRVETFGDN